MHTRSGLSVKCLVDTNVLVYTVDPRNATKSLAANTVLQRLNIARTGVTTAQVVAEFYNDTTRQRRGDPLLPASVAVGWLAAWLGVADFVELTRQVSAEALRAAYSYSMNIYDAQMWAVARVHRIPVLLTEDAQFSDVIEGVRYVNPFDESFVLADLGL